MTLLALIRQFCVRTGIPQPSVITNALDQQTQQVVALLNEILEDLMDHNWTGLAQESVFTSTAAEDQGAITTLAPTGFKWILPQTFYDRTSRLQISGPLSASQWQALKALPNSGPYYEYRIARGHLLLNPAPPVGHEIAFEYASSWCVTSADGVTQKVYASDDGDTFTIPDSLLLAGLRWKWKYEKGLDYAEDFTKYESLRENALGRDGTKPVLHMDGEHGSAHPGIFVPAGNWNIP